MITRSLFVGVSRYQAVSSLPDAVRHDVNDIVSLLVNPDVAGLDASGSIVLLDEQATAAAIRSAFGDLSANMPENATFLFYFSGHGDRSGTGAAEQSWLLPHDADLDNIAATGMSSEEVVRLLCATGARRQVVMIDSCHAGGIGAAKRKGQAVPKGMGEGAILSLAQGAGRALLTSSRADETSLILGSARNSVFTTAVIEALKGGAIDRGDGRIGVLDVFDYVSHHVPLRANQHPIFHASDLDTNFALARRHDPKRRQPDLNELVAVLSDLYPTGPMHDHIWSRAGGNAAHLVLSGSGIAQWHSALTRVSRGGGGLTLLELLQAVSVDYPGHPLVSQP